MDADADLHLVVTELEQRGTLGRRRARGERDAHRAGDRVDLLADAYDLLELRTLLGLGPAGLHDEEVAGHAATADRPGGVLHRDVVVDEQRGHLEAVGLGELLRHLERHAIARVVVHEQQDALVGRDELGRLVHVVGRRCGEDVARAGGVEHAGADHHDVGGLVA